MYNPERDLAYVEAMASQMKAYLLSDSLYWNLGSYMGAALPHGLIGGLYIRLHQLAALPDALSYSQAQRLEAARQTAQAELDHWAAQAEIKMLRECEARLGPWKIYLEEVDRSPARHVDDYASQVVARAALALLLPALSGLEEGRSLAAQTARTDETLRFLTVEHPFVWDDALAPAYPQGAYWWLYRLPDVERKRRQQG